MRKNLCSTVRLSFHRIEQTRSEGVEFAQELRRMLAEFNVATSEVTCTPSYTKKNGLKTYEILFRVKMAEENILKFCHGVGFRYSKRKKMKADLAGEYLRIKASLRSSASNKLALAQEMRARARGTSLVQISESLALAQQTAKQWANGLAGTPLVTSAQVPPFEEWMRRAKLGLDGRLVWVAEGS